MSSPQLKLFTAPWVTRRVGIRLFAEFFGRFIHHSKFCVAAARPDNEDLYYDALARHLTRPNDLPDSLIQALHDIEATAEALHRPDALPEDDPARDPEHTASTRLRQAIELWLAASKPREDGLRDHPEPFQSITASLQYSSTPPSAAPSGSAPSLTSFPVKESGANGQPESEQSVERTEIPTGRDTPPSEAPLSPFSPVQNSGTNGHPEAPHSAAPSLHHSINSTSANPLIQESDSAAFVRLARLPLHEYDRLRRAEAKRLHLRLASLDDAVDHARLLEDDVQANDIYLSQLKPWPEPILDAPALFDEIHARFPVYLWLPPGAAVVFTFWAAHAHAFGAFTQSPRLNLTSIDPGCGKSTVLSVLATMCPKVLRTDNLKTAVLFRVVDLHRPTLLLDELDSYLHLYPELRGLLNASNTDDACVYRCEGHAVRAFKAYAPIALAGIGHLSPTLRHRSIVISLSEAPLGALLTRFDKRRIETEKNLGCQLARWAHDNFAAIAACDPVMPPAAHNRLADKWRPLFAIAQVVGGHWPERTANAFHALNPKSHKSIIQIQPQKITSADSADLKPNFSQKSKIENQNSKIHAETTPHSEAPSLQLSTTPTLQHSSLLSSLRSIFAQAGTDRLFSTTIVARLRALPDRPWSEPHNGHKPIDEAWLALQLRPLAIGPHNVRIAGAQAKGYRLTDFTQAFARFLRDLPPSST